MHPVIALWQSNWLDGLATWGKLVAVVISLAIGYIGYRVNQELFKVGGVMDRLGKMSENQVRLDERSADHERRIGDLERWRNSPRR